MVDKVHSATYIQNNPVQPSNEEGIYVFVSFDIVGSTRYKMISNDWYNITEKFYSDSMKKLNEEGFVHWRNIGDEAVFYKRLVNEDLISIHELPKRVFKIMNIIRDDIFVCYPNSKMILSLKGTLWIDHIKNLEESGQNLFQSYIIEHQQNLYINDLSGNNRVIDFLGVGVDLGFRLREETQKNQLVISAELIYLIIEVEKQEHSGNGLSVDKSKYRVSETKSLKGIWYDRPYPVIFYREDWEGDAFEYDELPKQFQDVKVEEYIPKVFKNLGRDQVLNAFIPCIKKSKKVQKMRPSPLAFHVVLMHFSKDLKKILLYKRASDRSNSEKYDFGCVHLEYNKDLEESIKEYYSNILGTDKYTILRNGQHPIPVAVYTYSKTNGDIVNGLIFCAKLDTDIDSTKLEIDGYSEIVWKDLEYILSKSDDENNLFKGSVDNIHRASELLKKYRAE